MEKFASARAQARCFLCCALISLGLAACSDDASSGNPSNPVADSSTQTVQEGGPSISGTPPVNVTAGAKYSFQPTASTATGSPLKFSVLNKPDWAAFDSDSGRLTGTPTSAQVGKIDGIVIAVSDGATMASLPAFSIIVFAPGTGPIGPTEPKVPVGKPIPPITPISGPTSAPTISGQPITTLVAGTVYSFKPIATGPSGSSLQFSIQNKPSWAVFNTATGALTGTPTAVNAGSYSNIIVSVSDGAESASLAAFTVTVTVATATSGTVTVDWTPPTENTDGSVLTNLAGYHLYYGQAADQLTQTIEVTNAGLTAYTLTNLHSGTWYFAVSSFSKSGVESARTNVVSTTL